MAEQPRIRFIPGRPRPGPPRARTARRKAPRSWPRWCRPRRGRDRRGRDRLERVRRRQPRRGWARRRDRPRPGRLRRPPWREAAWPRRRRETRPEARLLLPILPLNSLSRRRLNAASHSMRAMRYRPRGIVWRRMARPRMLRAMDGSRGSTTTRSGLTRPRPRPGARPRCWPERSHSRALSTEVIRENPDHAGWTFGIITLDPALLDDAVERVNITLPRRVLCRLDALARAAGESRSGFIAHLTLEAPRRSRS